MVEPNGLHGPYTDHKWNTNGTQTEHKWSTNGPTTVQADF